jgi:hypothetical protein
MEVQKMKKSILVVGLLLAASAIVYAGALKIALIDDDGNLATADGGIHANANGFVIVNFTPKGTTDVAIQIQLRDAAPQYEYTVKSAGEVIGTFTTNKKGTGGLHINMEDETVLGGAVNIWNENASTRLLRAILPSP